MLTQRLVRLLNYNSNQYIITRSRRDYTAAVARLENMRKLVFLIRQTCDEGRGKLTPDEAIGLLRIQRHLHALHILPPDEMPSPDVAYFVAA